MRTRISLTFLTLSLALIAAGCCHDFSCGDISLSVDKAGQLHIASAAASTPLVRDVETLSTLTADGAEVAFGPAEKSSRVLTDTFGKGNSLVLESDSERGLVREISVTAYDRYPSTFVVRASYTNESDSDIAVNGWSVCDLKVNAAGDDPCFWSFQCQSTEERDD